MLLILKAQRSLFLVNRTPVHITSCTESDGVNNHVKVNTSFIANTYRCFECVQLLTSNPPSITFGVLVKNRKSVYIKPLFNAFFASMPLTDLCPYLICALFFILTL